MKELFHLVSKLHMTGTETLTPPELVEEMLDRLPTELWSDPTKTFLDPAMGTGTFYLCLLQRLDRGLEGVIPDRGERLRHIMSRQLFGCEIDRKQLRRFEASLRHLGLEQHVRNVYNLDSLQHEWNMKFDVVVGNPPYNPPVQSTRGVGGRTNLWKAFVLTSIRTMVKPGGYISFIHPPTWRAPSSSLKKSRVDGLWDIMTQRNHMMFLRIYTTSPFSGASTKADYYVIKVLKKNQVPGDTAVIDCDNVKCSLKLSEWEFLPHGKFNQVKRLLARKEEERLDVAYSSTLYDVRSPYVSKVKNGEFQYPILVTTLKQGPVWHWASEIRGECAKPKLMFSESALNDVIMDKDGNFCYGTGIISVLNNDVVSDHDKFKEFMMNEFQELAPYLKWRLFHLSPCFFTKLRKNFYQ